MRTGLTKKQKTTVIYFDEASDIIEVQTHNTDLKRRLRDFSQKHPQCCRQTDDDEQGGQTVLPWHRSRHPWSCGSPGDLRSGW